MTDSNVIDIQKHQADAQQRDWRDRVIRTRSGTPMAGIENVVIALRHAPEFVGLLRLNEFSLNIDLTRPPPWRSLSRGSAWTDKDSLELEFYLGDQHAIRLKQPSPKLIGSYVEMVATQSPVHPVRDYLTGLAEWDGLPRIDSWLSMYLHARTQPADYVSQAGRLWLIQAIARVMVPGTKTDYAIVLEGPENKGKSAALRRLAANEEWFTDQAGDLRNKDSAIALQGRWIVELAELSSVTSADNDFVKSWLSRTHDDYRPPYASRSIRAPRQCVFAGSTNQHEWMRGRTGNRRYWPIHCDSAEPVDLDAFSGVVPLLWAEALHAYKADVKSSWFPRHEFLAGASREQGTRLPADDLHDALVGAFTELPAEVEEVLSVDIWSCVLKVDMLPAQRLEFTRRHAYSMTHAAEAAGWRKVGRAQERGQRGTRYRRKLAT
jgi:putative DNA primase/helicase